MPDITFLISCARARTQCNIACWACRLASNMFCLVRRRARASTLHTTLKHQNVNKVVAAIAQWFFFCDFPLFLSFFKRKRQNGWRIRWQAKSQKHVGWWFRWHLCRFIRTSIWHCQGELFFFQSKKKTIFFFSVEIYLPCLLLTMTFRFFRA